MPLILTLRSDSTIPLEVDTVRPESVRGLSTAEVEKLPVVFGNRSIPLAERFRVTGSAAEDSTLVWEGDLTSVKQIGARMTTGVVRVAGNAGMHLGAEMRGGEIVVEGNTGDWTGAEMHGGRIVVRGRAGDLVGAVYRGGPRGMTGGEILVHGDAGDEVGHTLRRGLIAVGGTIGSLAGCHMIAGTLVVGGDCGPRPGAGMKRGTIVVLGEAPKPLSSFRLTTSHAPIFLGPYWRHLRELGFPLGDVSPRCSFRHFCGDSLSLGKGDLLLRSGSPEA